MDQDKKSDTINAISSLAGLSAACVHVTQESIIAGMSLYYGRPDITSSVLADENQRQLRIKNVTTGTKIWIERIINRVTRK